MSDKKQPLLSTSQWKRPSLVDESNDMMQAATMIYAFADLRALAQKGVLASDGDKAARDRIMSLPVTVGDVMQVLSSNRRTLRSTYGEENVDFYLTALESMQSSVRMHEIDAESGEAVLVSQKLLIFDDANSRKELVYGVAVNSGRKRITVAFRGSVTTSDFVCDAKAFLNEIPNPLKPGTKATVGIHHGFYDYLFGPTRRPKTGTGKSSKCKIILEQVALLFEQYPDHRLYVTGHSLGGALATLFAFEAAASTDPRIPKPVTCISVASPKCGNLAFRNAFQALEKSGMIRCLRIANYKDLVTLMPDRGSFSCLYIMCCQRNVYRHVGLELKLFKSGKHHISYPQGNVGYVRQFMTDWAKQVKHGVVLVLTLPFMCCFKEDFLANHSCKEYLDRFTKFAKVSGALSLDDEYEQKVNIQASH